MTADMQRRSAVTDTPLLEISPSSIAGFSIDWKT